MRHVWLVVWLLLIVVLWDFDFMRYFFEYFYNVVKWRITNRCSYNESPRHGRPVFMTRNNSWESLLDKYKREVHDNQSVTKWVVSRPDVGLGICNRIHHSISMLLFAMVTRRKLRIQWTRQNAEYITNMERAGATDYNELFVSEFMNNSFSGIENISQSYHCLYERILFSRDLDAEYSDVVRLEGGDWWGSLFFSNLYYRHTIFRGLNLRTGYPFLFRKLFTPLNYSDIVVKPCSWLIQYRSVWDRRTASIDAFIQCALQHGLTPSMYPTTYILTDDPERMMASARYSTTIDVLKSINIPKNKTCRGPCGDRASVAAIYEMSQCQNAVITLGSSFATCSLYLGGVRQLFKVGYLGNCIQQDTSAGPVDANSYSYFGNILSYMSTY